MRVVHRNKLLKVDELPLDVFDDKSNTKGSEKSRKKIGKEKKKQVEEKEEHLEIEDSDEEEMALVVERTSLVGGSADMEPDSVDVADQGCEDSSTQEEGLQNTTVDEMSDVQEESVEEVDAATLEGEESGSDAETAEDETTTSEDETPPRRISTRTKAPRTVYTYSKLGGDLVGETVR